MSKWRCEICGSVFDNFHAQGFGNRIYCPLCYFKKLSADLQVENYNLQQRIDKANEYIQDFIFEPLLTNEDRKLIICNQNLKKFENILQGKEVN